MRPNAVDGAVPAKSEAAWTTALREFYLYYDRDDRYEHEWGYINPAAAAYWRMRDELVAETLLKHFDTPRLPLRILEVGVGHGHELAKFGQLGVPHPRLTGVDLLLHRLARAKSTYPSLNLSQQDATELAFADNTFDVVCQFLCVEHALSRELQSSICRELARVLKPGGIIVWFDMAPFRWGSVIFRRLQDLRWLTAPRSEFLSRAWSYITESLHEMLVPSRRKTVCEEATNYPHLLVIPPHEVVKMFPGLRVSAADVGLDFTIWAALWRHSRSLAQILWRIGWLPQHCFAVIEK